MRSPLARLAPPALLLLVGLALGGRAQAQLDLPRKAKEGERASAAGTLEPRRQRGDLVPYLECTICYERNTTTPRALDANGRQQAYCRVCQKSTLHRGSDAARGGAELALPAAPLAPPQAGSAARVDGAGGSGGAGGAGGAEEERAPLGLPDAVRVAARAFDLLDRLPVAAGGTAPGGAIERTAQTVLAMGDAGVLAARLELAGDAPARLLAATHVLLAAGVPADGDAVVRRLRGRVPDEAAAALVELLARLDPVRASPELFVELVDHPQPAVRAAALRRVRALPADALAPHLHGLYASRRTDAREKAVTLAAASVTPQALALLLEASTDASARVAGKAVEALARRGDEGLEAELERRAFGERWILRSQAYALLALVEREDALLRPLLDERHVEPLLAGLQTQDPFVAGSCAAALAGIGFRSPRPTETPWLDRLVPERLVWAVSGREFHNDTSSLLGPALRRLQVLAGARPQGDGRAWLDWWLAARDGFRSQRAYLEVGPLGADALGLAFRTGGARPAAFVLLGPAAGEALSESPGERLVLSSAEAASVLAVLEREGLLGAERLPGLRGARSGVERTLELALGAQRKRFQLAEGTSEPWFERVVAMASEVRERNRWQRYPPPGLAADPAAFRAREEPFWASEQDERARARRLADLVLAWLPAQPLSQREGALEELERLLAAPGVVRADDFPALLALLAEERFHAERARRLVGLCLRAGAADASPAATEPVAVEREPVAADPVAADPVAAEPVAAEPSGAPPEPEASLPLASRGAAEPRLPRERALALLDVLVTRFGPAASEELLRVVDAAGRELARELARGERALLRAVAGAALTRRSAGGEAVPEDVQTALGLLADRDPAVQVALIRALGHERVEEARTELLLRARVAEPLVRQEALRAIGELGGEFVYEALLLALGEEQPELRAAAAVGLARLADPRSAPHLARLLEEPRDSEAYGAGLAGLERLGAPARAALGRIVHSRDHPARRDAALVLARLLAPEVVPALIALVEAQPDDEPAAFELCVLTCLDPRATEQPVEAWWSWWDGVVHDDPTAWLLAALERRGLAPPDPEWVRGAGSADSHRFLLGVIEVGEPWLAERARRELERQLGRPVPPVPSAGAEREAWLAAARRWVDPALER